MSGSIIHAAFDPRPYLLFSSSAISLGLLAEMGFASPLLRRLTEEFRRAAVRTASWAYDRSCSHLLRMAKR